VGQTGLEVWASASFCMFRNARNAKEEVDRGKDGKEHIGIQSICFFNPWRRENYTEPQTESSVDFRSPLLTEYF